MANYGGDAKQVTERWGSSKVLAGDARIGGAADEARQHRSRCTHVQGKPYSSLREGLCEHHARCPSSATLKSKPLKLNQTLLVMHHSVANRTELAFMAGLPYWAYMKYSAAASTPAAAVFLRCTSCCADPMCSEGASSGIVGNSQDVDEAMSTPTARLKQRPSSSGVCPRYLHLPCHPS